jgi:LacI family transcriptional regulator
LAAGTSSIVGFVVIDLSNSFFLDMTRGAETTAKECGFFMLLADTDMDPERQSTYLGLFDQQQCAGILLAPLPGAFADADRIRSRGRPVVMLNEAPARDDICAVLVDNEFGGWLATRHLIEQGCRRLAFVGQIETLPPIRERYLGAVKAVNETNGAVSLELIPTEEVQTADGDRTAHQLLGRNPSLLPDGVIAGADLLAAGLMQTLMANSDLRFPQDMAIVGYDDNRSAWDTLIPLSTLSQPGPQMGELATQMLIEEITSANSHVHRRIVLKPTLIERESSRRTRQSS